MAHQQDDLPIAKLITITLVGLFAILALAIAAKGAFHQMSGKVSVWQNQGIRDKAVLQKQSQKKELGDIESSMISVTTE